MRKCFLFIVFISGLFINSSAQVNDVATNYCATDQKMHAFIQHLSPQERSLYQQQRKNYEQNIKAYIQANKLTIYSEDHQKTIKFVIPVVFHIIHQGGPENISVDQVLNAMEHMNNDYQKLNADLSNTIPYFQSRIANIQIEFKLAHLDPNGNCTNGITRTYSHSSYTGDTQAQIQAVRDAHGDWPGDEYLNIFVARNIGGAAGFTMYPNNWLGGSMANGIHVLDTYTGTIGTADWRGAHTLSHEIGHWLNLSHLWGDSNDPGTLSNCQTDDHVQDTPDTEGWTTCDKFGKTCAAQDTSTYDNVQNIMEYSYCSTMFTKGQKARMWAALNSNIGGRNHIWSAENLAATGVNLVASLCAANFKSNLRVVCPNETVAFTDMSYSNPTGWKWNFPGATPTTSTLQSPTVVYQEPGYYNVKLTAEDGSNSVSKTKVKYIRVLNKSASIPFVEGFENIDYLDSSGWVVSNLDQNEKFHIINNVSYIGDKGIVLKNYGQSKGSVDRIASSPIDLSNVSGKATLTFRFSYRKRSADNNEKLKVAVSKDCGNTWEVRYLLSGSSLGNEVVSQPWKPTSQNDWVTVNVPTILSSYWVDNLRVRFEFVSDGGNNLYIDNINLYQGGTENLGVIAHQKIKGLSIFPNPATDNTTISFSSNYSFNGSVQLVNMMGQTICSQRMKVNSGKNLVLLNTKGVESGVYLVKVQMGETQEVKRLIIK